MALYLIWFLIGVGFLLIELVMPGFIIIFFCLGAWVAAAVAFLTELTLQYQVGIFVVASLVSLFTLRKLCIRTFIGQSKDNLDEGMADARLGKTAEVTRDIGPHSPGEIKFSGSFWRAVADEDIASGAAVVIESVATEDGLTYKVKPVGGGA